MSWFWGDFDPYVWLHVRRKGKGLFFVDYGLLPGFVVGIGYAILMAFLDSGSSPYLNAALFTLAVTPLYVLTSHFTWEFNEDAFASWVADEGERLLTALGDEGESDDGPTGP